MNYIPITILSLIITILDVGYTAIVADLLTILQGSTNQTVISKMGLVDNETHMIYLLGGLLIFRFLANDQIYFLLNKLIYSVYQFQTNKSLNSRLSSIASSQIFDDRGRAVKNYTTDINIFIGGFLAPIVQLAIDTLVILGLATYASFYINIDVKIVFGILFSTLFLFITLKYLSKAARRHGRDRNAIDERKTEFLSELSGTWRSLIDLKAQNFYIQMLDKFNAKYTSTSIKISRSVNLTKLTIETYVGLMLLSICIIASGQLAYSPATAAAAVAIFLRVVPTINRSAQAFMAIQSSIGALESLKSNYSTPELQATYNIDNTATTLKINSCNVYNDHKTLLSCHNINIPKNKLSVITAPSCTGKSILLQTLHQELKEQSFTVAYIPQNFNLLSTSLLENMYLGKSVTNQNNALEVLKKVGFTKDKALQLLSEERSVHTLSGGETQRLFITRYLVNNFDYLFMDEITSALDSLSENHLLDVLKTLSGGCTIVINSHSEQLKQSNVNHINLLEHLT